MSDYSMLDLYQKEVEIHGAALNQGVLALEAEVVNFSLIEPVMRAAHSLKGAARIIGLDLVSDVAHALEDLFVAMQEEHLSLPGSAYDVIYEAVDFLNESGKPSASEMDAWLEAKQESGNELQATLRTIITGDVFETWTASEEEQAGALAAKEQNASAAAEPHDSVIRVSADSMNDLMGLAAESLVETKRFEYLRDGLLKIKRLQSTLSQHVDEVSQQMHDHLSVASEPIYLRISQLHEQLETNMQHLRNYMEEFDSFARKKTLLADSLYREVLSSRMRPFSEGVQGFPRLIRDLARSLEKKIHFEVHGSDTLVDRDVLEQLEAPLNHLLRNACDHGIELPHERFAAGKPEAGTIRIHARHQGGMLIIEIQDDGYGVDLEQLRKRVVEKQMIAEDLAADLAEHELLDFLFLPGFSTAEAVTDVSGRGVGLDAVMAMLQDVGGAVKTETEFGKGTTFILKLPVTRSVVGGLLVTIDEELYAFPLNRIERSFRLPSSDLILREDRQYFIYQEQEVGLVASSAVLGLSGDTSTVSDSVDVVLVSEGGMFYGFEVDELLGESDLFIRPLDKRLGKVPGVSAASVHDDGRPILMIDVDDMVQSVDKLLITGHLDYSKRVVAEADVQEKQRILVVDDSPTVRETERRVLVNAGFHVDSAVDGADGWNAVRLGHFDLVVTDIDMPRMHGFDLLSHIRGHAGLKDLPVVIVSYKDREQDRAMGEKLGVNAYLTKGSFHDDTFVATVKGLLDE